MTVVSQQKGVVDLNEMEKVKRALSMKVFIGGEAVFIALYAGHSGDGTPDILLGLDAEIWSILKSQVEHALARVAFVQAPVGGNA
jgi:hypothetical protein